MEKERIGAVLRTVLAVLSRAGAEGGVLAEETRLREDLGLDSVALIDLVVALEEQLPVYFDPLCAGFTEAFETVGSLERYLLGQASAA